MRAISANRRAVREALAHEGWRFALVGSIAELDRHQKSCRTLALPVGYESDNRSRTIREGLIARLPWEIRRHGFPRWLGYLSKTTRKRIQPYLPLAAEFCLTHGFIFLVGNIWAERQENGWRTHRMDGPAVTFDDRELYFWRGWPVSKKTVVEKPTAEKILKEKNQTEREVLIQRMGVENFVNDAELKPVDSYRDTVLLKVDTADTRSRYDNGRWTEAPLSLAFIKVVCPRRRRTIFSGSSPTSRTRSRRSNQPCPDTAGIGSGIWLRRRRPFKFKIIKASRNADFFCLALSGREGLLSVAQASSFLGFRYSCKACLLFAPSPDSGILRRNLSARSLSPEFVSRAIPISRWIMSPACSSGSFGIRSSKERP